MKNKIISLALILILCFSLYSPALAAGSYSNFSTKNSYANQFTDVSPDNWFAEYVKQAYEYGLIQGVSATSFEPDDYVTIAQTIVLAVRLHSIFSSGAEPDLTVPPGGEWYDPYVSYALTNDMIASEYNSYSAPALRSEVAEILSKALPAESLNQIRTVPDGAIPDVPASAPYSSPVYLLYRAGILSGSDTDGTFNPGTNIKRSEIAAICVRIADPSRRDTKTIGVIQSLTAMQISEKCSPAVFTIQVYSYNGKLMGNGSGFFISSDGYAITNYHVAAAGLALVTTHDGKVFDKVDDVRLIDVDKENDLALIKVSGSGFPYLELGDSDTVRQGQQVYAIGSPIGLDNTMSQGIVANANRVIDGVSYTQVSIPIGPGSSGGALIDEYGKAIGVTSAGFTGAGADLNLAVPINKVRDLDRDSSQVHIVWNDIFYPGFSQVLDFGAFAGTSLLYLDVLPLNIIFEYDAFDYHDALFWEAGELFARSLAYYFVVLEEAGFKRVSASDEALQGRFETDTEWVEISYDLYEKKTITVSAGLFPQYYAEFSKLPDFGWYMGMEMIGDPSYIDGSTMYEYKWSDYYYFDSFSYSLVSYFLLLESEGFVLIGSDTTATGDLLFLFEGHRLSVCYIITPSRVFIDVLPI